MDRLVRPSFYDPDMSQMAFDNSARIDMTCPKCEHKWSVRLGDMRDASLRCPHCQTEIDTVPFAKEMESAERKLRTWGRRR